MVEYYVPHNMTRSFVPLLTRSKKTSAVDIKLTSVFVMLRKCVNHPYLLEFPLDDNGDFLVDEQLVVCCGKMMLLDRMLTALLEQGHKVRSGRVVRDTDVDMGECEGLS